MPSAISPATTTPSCPTNYDRWFTTALALADMLDEEPPPDAACGTGVLAKMPAPPGGNLTLTFPAMAREARRKHPGMPVAVADLRASFGPRFNIVTCLFDSLNSPRRSRLAQALRAFPRRPRRRRLYADFITERMVVDHFEGRDWSKATTDSRAAGPAPTTSNSASPNPASR